MTWLFFRIFFFCWNRKNYTNKIKNNKSFPEFFTKTGEKNNKNKEKEKKKNGKKSRTEWSTVNSLPYHSIHPGRVGFRHLFTGKRWSLDDKVVEWNLDTFLLQQLVELLPQQCYLIHANVYAQVVMRNAL